MKKSLLLALGFFGMTGAALATTCGGATALPAFPSMPHVETLVCGGTNDVNSGNAVACGSLSYVGGLEALYTWTPTYDYTGVTIAYTGQTYTGIFVYNGCPTSGGICVANITSSASSKTLNVGSLTAGVTYYIMIDTWPSPASPCPGSFTLNGTVSVATPPTPTQAPGVPTCSAGSTIDVVGTPATDVTWYWQSSASGTDMTQPYAGPYTIFANGTYYLRAYNTVAATWSASSSSITVTNFPTAATPPVPVAAMNPACVTDGTTLTEAAAPMGLVYYWQGTSSTGTSTADDAVNPYAVSTSGTYYVRAYDPTSQCWSDASGLAVTISTLIPYAPSTTDPTVFACTGDLSAIVSADPTPMPVSGNYTLNMIDSWGDGWNGNTIDVLLNGVPVLSGVTLPSGSAGSVTFPVNEGDVITTVFNAIGSYVSECSFNVMNQSMVVVASGNYLANIPPYTVPMPGYTIEWFDAPSAGTSLGTGNTLESVGTTVLPNTSSAGDYSFYAMTYLNGCYSSETEIVVAVSSVNVTLVGGSVTCNNGNDGTFTQSAVQCGTAPFTYSVDGGAFGAIPTNLTVGSHTVVVQDVAMNTSGTYAVVIGDALAPSALSVTGFTNDMIDITWTGNGSETEWFVEWGAPGFTPGTGTEIGSAGANANFYNISGLDGNTQYDIYVAADCGSGTTPGTWILVSQTTLCDPFIAQAFCESFDSDSPTEECWTVKNQNADADAWDMNYTLNTYSGDQTAVLYTDFNAGANDDWLISPMLTLSNNEILTFNYRVQSSGEPNDFRVMLSTTGMDPADFTEELMALNSYSNITYADTSLDLSAYSGDCYIAFHVPAGGLDGWRLYIDQVCVDICIPAPGVDGNEDVCRLDNTLDLNTVITQGETNGVWEFLPNPGVVSGSNLNLGLLPDGTYNFEYIVTTACTTDTTIATVTVYPASSAGNDGVINDICSNWSAVNLVDGLSGTIDLGGNWNNVSGEGTLTGSLWQPEDTTMSGAYDFEYVVNNSVCPNDTAVVTVNIIDCTGMTESEINNLVIYPNPVVDVLAISNLEITNGVIEVMDIQGKIVNSFVVTNVNGNFYIDMSDVQRGVYVIRVISEDFNAETRVIKN